MLITLTTDFGLRDPFVGIMKGVIAGINPLAQVIDLTHCIPRQDVLAGALALRHSIAYFPRRTIHVAVVDPGVGTARRPLLIECDDNYFIGPDNGVLSLAIGALKTSHIVELSNPSYHAQPTSATFHGRDIFAPAAAHLSLGVPPSAFGPPINTFVKLALPTVARRGNTLEGRIVYIDTFGNLFTNIAERDLTGIENNRCEISVGTARVAGLSPNYAAVPLGEHVAIINSWGLLEIAVNGGSAQRTSSAGLGDEVRVVLGS